MFSLVWAGSSKNHAFPNYAGTGKLSNPRSDVVRGDKSSVVFAMMSKGYQEVSLVEIRSDLGLKCNMFLHSKGERRLNCEYDWDNEEQVKRNGFLFYRP
jgi:hypothetical protein